MRYYHRNRLKSSHFPKKHPLLIECTRLAIYQPPFIALKPSNPTENGCHACLIEILEAYPSTKPQNCHFLTPAETSSRLSPQFITTFFIVYFCASHASLLRLVEEAPSRSKFRSCQNFRPKFTTLPWTDKTREIFIPRNSIPKVN